MRERPIIMSSESVRAILAGRKTQTRRVCKPQPVLPEGKYRYDGRHEHIQNGAPAVELFDQNGEPTEKYFDCRIPKFEPGDRLWVKESYLFESKCYKADLSDAEYAHLSLRSTNNEWKNPMFMPRTCSRITLEVTGVRLERLQKISYDDVKSEGCQFVPYGKLPEWTFIEQWNRLNARRGFPWKSNPWVWVIEFKKLGKQAT